MIHALRRWFFCSVIHHGDPGKPCTVCGDVQPNVGDILKCTTPKYIDGFPVYTSAAAANAWKKLLGAKP